MKVAVRLDDITPGMDWERFLAFKELLDSYGIKPLIGVIPCNEDKSLMGDTAGAPGDFWKYVKNLQKEGWTVAMHGFRHCYTTACGGLFPLNRFSEFAGVPYEVQREMLLKGKELLLSKEIKTDVFMAPAHSYDNSTLRALKEAGFHRVTDGFGNRPYRCRGLTFYPISFRLGGTLKKKKGYSTLVVHAGTIAAGQLEGYRKMFERAGTEWISYEEYLRVPPVKRGLPGRMKEYLMAKVKHYLVRLTA